MSDHLFLGRAHLPQELREGSCTVAEGKNGARRLSSLHAVSLQRKPLVPRVI